MYENMTYEVILQRMLDRVPDTLNKREGSIIYDALAPAAVELTLAYMQFDMILNEAFGDTASRDYLIRRAKERGLTPEPATKAILQGEFTPSSIDVLNKRFNLGSLNYVVTELISPGVYKVQCETAGTIGNQYLDDIIPIDYIEGLETAKLTQVLIPGEDEEDTEVFRQRYFASFGEKSYGGNVTDYLTKTNSIPGVGSTKVTPIWDGGGTVKLTILDATYNKASSTLIDAVQNAIDPSPQGEGWGIAPIGHIVTVDTVEEVTVDIAANITFDTGYSWEALQTQAIAALEDYMLELRSDWANQGSLIVRIAQIETRLLAIEGIIDISGTTINGDANNLTLTTYQIPVLGSVTP
ncbi:MAG TPA: baseplate J/gp47 family protein [Fervidobacterium sp.]|nr:baseplate J/gp47 family protein [Fervidobacterium sp.]